MPDYKQMYLELFRATEQAIQALTTAQQTCEALYAELDENKEEREESSDCQKALPPTATAE